MPTTGGLMGMVTVSVRCLGCRAVLASRDLPDTRRDSPRFAEIRLFCGAYFFCPSAVGAQVGRRPLRQLHAPRGGGVHGEAAPPLRLREAVLADHGAVPAHHRRPLCTGLFPSVPPSSSLHPVPSSLGDNYKDVLGIARDSPIYYQMKKVQKDLNEARASRD